MKKKITIAIDAMGGDNSPFKTIEGVGFFVKNYKNVDDYVLNLFGDEKKISLNLDKLNINSILKDLYDTNFFKDISVSIENNILTINVIENPIINEIKYEGVKSKRVKEIILKDTVLKSRSSYNEFFVGEDKKSIVKNLTHK